MTGPERRRPRSETARRTARITARAFREFALAPCLVVAGFLALGCVAILADQSRLAAFEPLRRGFGDVIGQSAAASALAAIAPGLLTVTSITFSVLLLAVQQTASNLSPVVFDQFVRRRLNQVLLGFFVGLSVFAYVVMVAVQDKKPPIVGAGIATLLTIVAMLLLLVLVYVTIDQMRPSTVVRQIHDRTLGARANQEKLRSRTQRKAQVERKVSARCESEFTGYLTRIDLDQLEGPLKEATGAEVRFHAQLGTAVSYGDLLATVHDDTEEVARRLADAVRAAVSVERRRDIDLDATTGVRELVNIAWTNGSTAKQSPDVALGALSMLKDLAARWMAEEHVAPRSSPMRVVYADNDLDDVMSALFSLVVVAQESHQHQTAAEVLDAYRRLLPRAVPCRREQLLADWERMTPFLDDLPTSAVLEHAREQLENEIADVCGDSRAPSR
jgi:uncharacterized membrane protein